MNKQNLLISIIIPTYNRGNLLERCLQGLVSQTYNNWEAIVVDNYSSDNTEEIINKFKDSRIRFFKNHNYGIISVSRNFGIMKSKGDWICFLDSDDYWFENKLEHIIKYTGRYDLIYHGYITYKKGLFWGTRKKYESFYKIKENKVSYLLQRGDPINPSCSAMSRDFLNDTVFSEDSKFFAIEDYDFFLQLISRKPRIKYLKKYLTFYDSSTGVSHDVSKSLSRQKVIINKYKPFLTRKEKRNVLRLYIFNKGYGYFVNKNYKMALKCFNCSLSSTIFRVKRYSIGAMILSCLRMIIGK